MHASHPQSTAAQLPKVRGTLNYLAPMDEPPVFYTQAYHKTNLVFDAQTVDIHDFRAQRAAAHLDTTGFQLFDHDPGPLDLTQLEQTRAILVRETERFLVEHFGAPKIFMIQPVFRWSERESHPGMENSRPARFIHSDLTQESFEHFAREHIAGDPDADHWLSGRVAIFNTWRALSPPPQDCPLTLLDRQTLREADIVKGTAMLDLAENPFSFTTTLLRHNPQHRWGYFSNMTAKELLVFRNFDRADPGLPGPPHCAFDDPTHSAGTTAPRFSFEVRGFMYWGK